MILKHFPSLTSEQIYRFDKMAPLYRDLNRKIKIISRKEIDLLYENHVLHSLSIAKVISFSSGSKILDVGTGIGFPGIPLAILFPNCQFVLIDGIKNRIKIVRIISEALDLKNVTVLNTKVEDVFDEFDFVASRAVSSFPKFVGLVEKNISHIQKNSRPNGIIYLKGGDFQEEIKDFERIVEVNAITNFFNEPFFETKKVIYLPVKKLLSNENNIDVV